MKYFISFICLSLFALTACASDRITASITVTNITTNGMTFTVNGNVRTFTNNVTISGTQVATNADATGCGSKTNLFSQISLNLFSQVVPINTGSNTFQLQGACAGALVVSASAGYATVTYSTQTCATATPVGVPYSSYYQSLPVRTNTASQLEKDLNDYATNALYQSAPIAGQLLGTSNTQVVYGAKDFANTIGVFRGIVSNSPSIGGNISILKGGVITNANLNWLNGTYIDNNGNALFYQGLGIKTVLNQGVITLQDEILDGSFLLDYITAGTLAHTFLMSFSTNEVDILRPTYILAPLQVSSNLTVNGSVAIGGNETVGTNLTVGGSLTVTGGLTVQGPQTNGSHFGTNNFLANSDIAFTRKTVSSLANGGNAAVPIGTNVFIEVSGPSGSFSIDGISNGRDGKLITILNQTGFQMTINNESGTDPTAANRIKTLGSAGNLVLTNAACMFIYNGNSSRWIMLSHNP